jgi:hypothetical protein
MEFPVIKGFIVFFEVIGWFIVAIIVPVLSYLFKKHSEKLESVSAQIILLRNRQDEETNRNLERCQIIHEKENERLGNMATKQDVTALRDDMNAGFCNINNNILSIVRQR